MSARQWGSQPPAWCTVVVPPVSVKERPVLMVGRGPGSIRAGIPLSPPTTEVVGSGKGFTSISLTSIIIIIPHHATTSRPYTFATQVLFSFSPLQGYVGCSGRRGAARKSGQRRIEGPAPSAPPQLWLKAIHTHHHQPLLLSVVRIPH